MKRFWGDRRKKVINPDDLLTIIQDLDGGLSVIVIKDGDDSYEGKKAFWK